MAGIVLADENLTDAERANYVKKLAVLKKKEATLKMATAKKFNGDQKFKEALSIPGHILSDEIIEPGENHYTRELAKGSYLRIIDLEGQQAVDFLCFDLANTEIRYNNANSIKLNTTIYVTDGFKLYSDSAEVLMTVSRDTVGFHDTIGGACGSQVNYLRYGIKNTCNCRDNFIVALAKYGMQQRDIHANINFFMNVPVKLDGNVQIEEGRSRPGDFVELRAEKDVLVVISNCPQLYNDCSGWNPTPIRLIEWEKD